MKDQNNDKLVILWTSSDKEVALNMLFMYTLNAKLRGWWKDIDLIIWGPSSKLLSVDTDLQDHIVKIKESGVNVLACKACAENYGITNQLEDLGAEVKYMGEGLTEYLKEGYRMLTI